MFWKDFIVPMPPHCLNKTMALEPEILSEKSRKCLRQFAAKQYTAKLCFGETQKPARREAQQIRIQLVQLVPELEQPGAVGVLVLRSRVRFRCNRSVLQKNCSRGENIWQKTQDVRISGKKTQDVRISGKQTHEVRISGKKLRRWGYPAKNSGGEDIRQKTQEVRMRRRWVAQDRRENVLKAFIFQRFSIKSTCGTQNQRRLCLEHFTEVYWTLTAQSWNIMFHLFHNNFIFKSKERCSKKHFAMRVRGRRHQRPVTKCTSQSVTGTSIVKTP